MSMRACDRLRDEQAERDRHGLEPDPRDELEDEFELADRIADHASLPAGDPGCRAAARRLLGDGDRPPRPPIPEPQRPADGANARVGDRSGRAQRRPDEPRSTGPAPGHRATAGADEIETTR
jgi:hypothetical protein